MSLTELKNLNSLSKNYVKPKQKIFVYAPGSAPKIPDSVLRKQEMVAKIDTNKPTSPRKDTLRQPATESEPEVVKAKIHVVKSGESLKLIAGKYKVTVSDLQNWNNLSTYVVKTGQKLKVYNAPLKSGTSDQSAPGSAISKSGSKSSGNTRFIYYTIKPGDNLWDIADEHDVTVAQIKKLNDINNASYLKPGQKIKIPK